MIKKSIIVLFAVILIVLVGVNLYVEKDTIQIKILNEFDKDEEIINLDNSKSFIIDENDYISYLSKYYPPWSYINYIYRVNIGNNIIEVLKEIPDDYRTIKAFHYSKKDNKTYISAHMMNDFIDERKNSYFVRLNENLEVEKSENIEYFISNFAEIGDKIYAECNSEYVIIRDDLKDKNNIITMHEIDKNTAKLKEDESPYIFFETYEMKNGNRIIIKAESEHVNKQMQNKVNPLDVIVEMADNKGIILSSNEVKKVYPSSILFVELPNGNVVFNLPKGLGYNPKDQIFVYAKQGDKYSLEHKSKVKIPHGKTYTGVVKDNDNLGILVSEIYKDDGKNEIWMFDENIEKLIKKYKIENLIGFTPIIKIDINENTNKMYIYTNCYAIGEITFPE